MRLGGALAGLLADLFSSHEATWGRWGCLGGFIGVRLVISWAHLGPLDGCLGVLLEHLGCGLGVSWGFSVVTSGWFWFVSDGSRARFRGLARPSRDCWLSIKILLGIDDFRAWRLQGQIPGFGSPLARLLAFY